MAENIDFLEKKIEQYQRDLQQSRTEYEKPFDKEGELIVKTARLNELNAELDLENNTVQDVDLDEKEDLEKGKVAEREVVYQAGSMEKEGR